ncbi:hypothetical protein FNV43_RR23109 [Rhamnella rubrinervis]|uniref:Protein kinase domain-containing protein n=1 Tax=Rhamnella rubrinervis TaxID=2594499 RepID=A0A8K0GNU5_9ROSA|nr:hypothetical protein FNV43_RR23109 [Rhamnella rubrinervis]
MTEPERTIWWNKITNRRVLSVYNSFDLHGIDFWIGLQRNPSSLRDCFMQLNSPENLFDTMTSEAPGPPGRWIRKKSTSIVPNVGKNTHNNVSVQTGEEFSKEFLQERVSGKRTPIVIDMAQNHEKIVPAVNDTALNHEKRDSAVPQNHEKIVPAVSDTALNLEKRVSVVTNMAQNHEKRVGFNCNQNCQLGYEDLARILGLRRVDSECASEASEYISAKGSSREIEVEAYVDKLSRYNNEGGDSGHGSRKAFSELNCDTAGFGPTAQPIYKSESPQANNFMGSGISDGSQSQKMKFLCSFGGKILPRPSDGKLRYVGGETRIISIRKNISWDELVKKTSSICNQPHAIKYQLPDEDLDALISVSSEEDLQNMIEEYHGLERHDGSQRLRIFLIPSGESENAPSFEASTIQQNNPNYQYVAAVNGMVDPSPKKNTAEQNLATETSQLETKTSAFPLDTKSNFNAMNPNQFLGSQNINGSHNQYSPVLPIVNQHGDSKSFHIQSHGDNSCQGSYESNSSYVTTQLHPENSSYKHPPTGVVTSTNYHYHHPYKQADAGHPNQPYGGSFNDLNSSREFVNPWVIDQNDGDFGGFSLERPIQKERTFHSEKPGSRLQDPMGLLSQSNEPIDSHCGIPHAFSDSKLQESGGKSAYCSQEGMSPSSPLNFAKAQLSLLINSGTSQEKPTKRHENIDFNPTVRNKLQDNGSVEANGRSDFPNSSPCFDAVCRKEPTHKGADDIDDKSQTSENNLTKSNFTISNPSEKDPLTLEKMKRINAIDPFLDQDGKPYGGSSLAAGVEYKNKLPNIKPTPSFTNGSRDSTPVSSAIDFKPSVDNLMEHPKNYQHEEAVGGLRAMNQTAAFNDCALTGKLIGEQGNNAPVTADSEIVGLCPTVRRHSHNENTLSDLMSGLSNNPFIHEPAQLQPIARDVIHEEPLLISSVNLYPLPAHGDPGINSNLQKIDQPLLQNPIQDAGSKLEVSLLDDDFVNYPNPKDEKIGFGGSSYAESNVEEGKEKIQLESAVFVEDVINGFPPGIQSSSTVTPYVVDESIGYVISPTATEVESIIPESESEDGKACDEDSGSFSDAMIAEMEASIYGLQIIRNADLEELQELGSGTYGTVYHGKWRGSDVAIKRIKKSCFAGRSSEQERLTKDFWREAQILSNLHHPNVVAFYGVVPDGTGGTLATVTEYMVNGSLRHVLLKKDRSLDRRKKLIIAMDAAFGMEYLHSKNIVHFDLKCDNLLVNLRDPQRPICKVGDFGLSRIKRNTLVSGGVRGTLPWMAPELLNGSSNRVSEKVDVFSFGISMWEILTGEEPYANMHCGAIIGGIVKNTLRPPVPARCDHEWKKLMEQCWSPDPERRPSFTEITNRLRSMSIALQAKGPINQTRQTKPNMPS